MGRNSNFTEESLKSGWLSKRSQLKSRRFSAWSATSYKERWFVLSRTALIYYDSQEPSRRKEKGRFNIKDIKLVEKIILKDKEAGGLQIGIHEYTVCLIAKSDVERDEWIALIRNLVRANPALADKYHPRQWSAGRWTCCGDTSRSNPGKPKIQIFRIFFEKKPNSRV